MGKLETELENLIKKRDLLRNEYATLNAKQQALKILLNSLFGACASPYFRYNSRDISEGITLTGQLVIRYISKKLNEHLNTLFKTQNDDYIIFNDTDSIFPDSIIKTSIGDMSVKDLWDNVEGDIFEIGYNNTIKIVSNLKSISFNGESPQWNDVLSIKKHKVKKRMFSLSVEEFTVIVTEDHSLQVERNRELLAVKASEVLSEDLMIYLPPMDVWSNEYQFVQRRESPRRYYYARKDISYVKTSNFQIRDLGIIEEDVYDLEIDENHNFFANSILVHNSAGLNMELLVNKIFEDQTDKQKIVNFLDKFVQKYINPFLVEEFEKLTGYLNSFENRLSMNREVIADKGLWRGKKNYILQMYDKEGVRYTTPKMKIMGLETAKSSTPTIVRKKLEKAIKIILNGTEEEIQSFVKKFKDEFFLAPVEDIAFPRGVSDIDKWVSSNGSMMKGTPIHVRGAFVYNQLLKNINSGEYAMIKNGDKIKFVYLKIPNFTQSHVIAFLDSLPSTFGLENFIDKEMQFNKAFLEPLKSLSNIVGWNTEKNNCLDMFFE